MLMCFTSHLLALDGLARDVDGRVDLLIALTSSTNMHTIPLLLNEIAARGVGRRHRIDHFSLISHLFFLLFVEV
jgi:hypothetical protein